MGKRRKRSLDCVPCAKRSKVQERTSSFITNLTLPGFRYLGPGSSRNNGPPTNEIDAIAQKHDEAYDRVVDEFKESHNVKRSVEEIKKADQRFLEDMRKTRSMTAAEAVGKAVGLVGIGLKAAVEKSVGHTFYPDFDQLKAEQAANRIKVRAGDDFN